jgi:hypothetical protein
MQSSTAKQTLLLLLILVHDPFTPCIVYSVPNWGPHRKKNIVLNQTRHKSTSESRAPTSISNYFGCRSLLQFIHISLLQNRFQFIIGLIFNLLFWSKWEKLFWLSQPWARKLSRTFRRYSQMEIVCFYYPEFHQRRHFHRDITSSRSNDRDEQTSSLIGPMTPSIHQDQSKGPRIHCWILVPRIVHEQGKFPTRKPSLFDRGIWFW